MTLPHWTNWLAEIRQTYKLRNTYVETIENSSKLDRFAVWIAQRTGTMGFFLVILVWTLLWLVWNFQSNASNLKRCSV
jgi:hypothetical protein